jgi:hypothetical protein
VQLFFASNGRAFNIDGCCGSPPMEIATNLYRGEFLTNLFLAAFTAANSLQWIEGQAGSILKIRRSAGSWSRTT